MILASWLTSPLWTNPPWWTGLVIPVFVIGAMLAAYARGRRQR